MDGLILQSKDGASLGTLVCLGIFVVAMLGWLAIQANAALHRRAAVRTAKRAYHEALATLAANPSSADAKQQALARGRVYGNLTRDTQGTIIFDEVALMHEINATTQRATQRVRPVVTVDEQLRLLDQLRTEGSISEREYQESRTKILGDV